MKTTPRITSVQEDNCFCIMFLLFLFSAWDLDVLLLLVLQACVKWVPKNAAFIVDFEAIDFRRADRRCSK